VRASRAASGRRAFAGGGHSHPLWSRGLRSARIHVRRAKPPPSFRGCDILVVQGSSHRGEHGCHFCDSLVSTPCLLAECDGADFAPGEGAHQRAGNNGSRVGRRRAAAILSAVGRTRTIAAPEAIGLWYMEDATAANGTRLGPDGGMHVCIYMRHPDEEGDRPSPRLFSRAWQTWFRQCTRTRSSAMTLD
jgi:hypothetical protein